MMKYFEDDENYGVLCYHQNKVVLVLNDNIYEL